MNLLVIEQLTQLNISCELYLYGSRVIIRLSLAIITKVCMHDVPVPGGQIITGPTPGEKQDRI